MLLAARDCWETAVHKLPTDASVHLSCRIHNALGTLYLELDRPADALQQFTMADTLQRDASPTTQDRVATLHNIALANLRIGDVTEALPAARQAAELCVSDKEEPSLLAAVALINGLCLMNGEQWEQAATWMQRALDNFRAVHDQTSEAICLHNLGIITMELGNYAESGQLLQAALQVLGQVPDASLTAYAHTELGRLLYRQGEISAALHHGSAALRILWDNMGMMDRTELARLCRLFGSIFSLTGDRDAALSYLQRATTYFAQGQMWLDWTQSTQELDALIKKRGVSSARVAVALEDKEMLKFLTTLMGLMDTLVCLFPDLARSTGLVTKYSLILGRACCLNDGELARLSHAVRLRDIGLTSESEAAAKEEMRGGGHPVMSERILAMFGVPKESLQIVRHHHESYDGSGFPDGLAAADIPLGARIVCLAEQYVMSVERETANGPGYHDRAIHNLQMTTVLDTSLLDLLQELHGVEL